MHEDELAAAKSQLTYLKNLAYEQLERGNNRECVICQEEIGDELCVIGCGHAFHEECISWLFQRTPSQTITCPICRRKSIKSECMLASELDRSNGSNTRRVVRGSWGTKVTCLVSDLLSMPADDKAIVFSQWNKMLDVVAEALAENGLKFERIEGRRSYGTALTRFRSLPEVRVLLLPIKTGAQVCTHMHASTPAVRGFLSGGC
jgi:SNF2 family DNA or RNA helicase